MKSLIIICLWLTPSLTIANSQSDSTKYEYCELIGTHRAFTASKVTITVDFGQDRSGWANPRVKDEQTGKVKIFNSMVDALNYMGKDGWEFVQAYVVTTNEQNVYHWMLKKKR